MLISWSKFTGDFNIESSEKSRKHSYCFLLINSWKEGELVNSILTPNGDHRSRLDCVIERLDDQKIS